MIHYWLQLFLISITNSHIYKHCNWLIEPVENTLLNQRYLSCELLNEHNNVNPQTFCNTCKTLFHTCWTVEPIQLLVRGLLTCHQCDQMAILFFQYSAIYSKEKITKVCSKFCQILNKSLQSCLEDFFAKVAKFRTILSQCLPHQSLFYSPTLELFARF